LVVVTAAITTQVVSQDRKDDHGMQGMPPEMAEMMAKCEAAGTPGENHKLLEKKVGKWNGTVKMWMTPDMPEPMVSQCTTDIKWILGKHYLHETVEGDFGGQTFLGQSWAGYDNVLKKFTWAWIDSMGTGIMTAKGDYDASKKTFTYQSEAACPMTEKVCHGRSVERWVDDNTMVFEMYAPWYKTGKEYKAMEISYKRAK
jgi:hypothetical protein